MGSDNSLPLLTIPAPREIKDRAQLMGKDILEFLNRTLQFREISVAFLQVPARKSPVIRCQIQVVRVIVDHRQILNDL